MNLTDARLSQQGCQKLELALLSFFEQFRKIYVGDQVSHLKNIKCAILTNHDMQFIIYSGPKDVESVQETERSPGPHWRGHGPVRHHQKDHHQLEILGSQRIDHQQNSTATQRSQRGIRNRSEAGQIRWGNFEII